MTATNPKEFLRHLCQRSTLLSYGDLVGAVGRLGGMRFLQSLGPFPVYFFLILTLAAVHEN